jgi:hypothetical protein
MLKRKTEIKMGRIHRRMEEHGKKLRTSTEKTEINEDERLFDETHKSGNIAI